MLPYSWANIRRCYNRHCANVAPAWGTHVGQMSEIALGQHHWVNIICRRWSNVTYNVGPTYACYLGCVCWGRWCPGEPGIREMITTWCYIYIYKFVLTTDLKRTGELQWIQQWNKQLRSQDDCQDYSKHVHKVLRPLGVHFRGSSENQNGGHEGDQNGYGYWYKLQTPSAHQKFWRSLLAPADTADTGVEYPNPCRNGQHGAEKDPVPNVEFWFRLHHVGNWLVKPSVRILKEVACTREDTVWH